VLRKKRKRKKKEETYIVLGLKLGKHILEKVREPKPSQQ